MIFYLILSILDILLFSAMIKKIEYAKQIESVPVLRLTPEKKLEQTLNLYFNARELKTSAIKKFHPDLNKKEVSQKVKEIFLYAKS